MSALPAPLLAGGLAAVGLIAAGPGSALLAAATWPYRRPTAALVLWQAVCLCAGLSLTGAALVLGVEPLGDHLPGALLTLADNTFHGRPFDGLAAWRVVLLGLAVVFGIALLAVLVRCTVLALRRRKAHRELLDLLTTGRQSASATDPEALPAEVRVLDHAAPMAYSVPGWHTRLVLTAGLVDLLTPEQLAAVIGHERAHLRSHHDLLLLPFQAWAAALGRLPGVRGSRQAVSTLAEMQADDAAARETGADAVASALATVALAGSDQLPTEATAELPEVGGTAVVDRVNRLRRPRPLGTGPTILVGLLAAALLCIPTALLVVGWS